MFRIISCGLKAALTTTTRKVIINYANYNNLQQVTRQFSLLQVSHHQLKAPQLLTKVALNRIASNITETKRTVTKFSWRKGKRKSVRAVLNRFYRLHWGGWIRTKCGRHKRIWKKRTSRRQRLKQHVLCNATQSTLLDKMVGPYWTKRRYYVNDPYEPYHSREEYEHTYSIPKPFVPLESQLKMLKE